MTSTHMNHILQEFKNWCNNKAEESIHYVYFLRAAAKRNTNKRKCLIMTLVRYNLWIESCYKNTKWYPLKLRAMSNVQNKKDNII